MTELIKVNDSTVAIITEQKSIFGKTELINRKANLEAELLKVNAMLDVLE